MSADPTLFPRDRELFEPQMRLWLGDSVLGWLASGTNHLPVLFAVMYVDDARRSLCLGRRARTRSWRELADRRRVSRSPDLEASDHAHGRQLARRLRPPAHARLCAGDSGAGVSRRAGVGAAAAVTVAAAAIVHVTTAIWFGAVDCRGDPVERAAADSRGFAAVGAGRRAVGRLALTFTTLGTRLVVMDSAWIQAIGDRSYLFSAQWPASAWILNLGYAVAIGSIYRRRRALGVVSGGRGRPGSRSRWRSWLHFSSPCR